MTVFGAGILIGTALNVIIPEGLHMWAEAEEGAHEQHEGHEEHDHEHGHGNTWKIGASIAFGFAFMMLVDRVSGDFGHNHSHGPEESSSACVPLARPLSLISL